MIQEALVEFLEANKGKILTREDIYKAVWGTDAMAFNSRTLDMNICTLRKKGCDITTFHGYGYRFNNSPF